MRFWTWNGAKDRELRVWRPCSCGCDGAGIGYLSGSNAKGEGFTLWLKTEVQFQALRAVFGEAN